MGPGERLKHLMTTKASAMQKVMSGAHEQAGRHVQANRVEVDSILREWPQAPKSTAQEVIRKYGLPNEAAYSRLVWYNNGPWKRTEIQRDEIPHQFPTAHTDFISQYIDYRVPPQRAGEIAEFDGSVLVDRTRGEVAARCDMESMNILSLNLMHEIIEGKRAVAEARQKYAEEASAHMMDRPSRYTQEFLFEIPAGGTADLDESIIADSMLHQMGEKIKDVFQGEERRH
jgi:hypothetical protein